MALSDPSRAVGDQAGESPVNDPRVYFAAERTFLAWIRTGLALMGFGFILARFGLFLRQIHAAGGGPAPPSSGFSVWLGVALVLIGVLVNIAAIWHHVRLVRGLRSGRADFKRPSTLAMTVAAVLVCVGAIVAAYLVFVQLSGTPPSLGATP